MTKYKTRIIEPFYNGSKSKSVLVSTVSHDIGSTLPGGPTDEIETAPNYVQLLLSPEDVEYAAPPEHLILEYSDGQTSKLLTYPEEVREGHSLLMLYGFPGIAWHVEFSMMVTINPPIMLSHVHGVAVGEGNYVDIKMGTMGGDKTPSMLEWQTLIDYLVDKHNPPLIDTSSGMQEVVIMLPLDEYAAREAARIIPAIYEDIDPGGSFSNRSEWSYRRQYVEYTLVDDSDIAGDGTSSYKLLNKLMYPSGTKFKAVSNWIVEYTGKLMASY